MISILRTIRKRIAYGLIGKVPLPYLEKFRENAFLKQSLDSLGIDCVLDVGANVGQFADDLRRIGYKGRIISFEPVRAVFTELSARLAGDSNWRGLQIGLGSQNERANIHIHKESDMSSLLDLKSSSPIGTEEIEIRRLDDLWGELNLGSSRVFLKIDTQGLDLEVFRGASGVLHKVLGLLSEVPVVPIYEKMTDYKTALTEYESAGFELVALSTVQLDRGIVIEMNALMSKGRGVTPELRDA